MGKIISVANQKGGVGKTTTSVNLAAGLAYLGKKVLLVDLDPQGNATQGLGAKKDLTYSAFDLLLKDVDINQCIKVLKIPPLHILPATIDLAGFDLALSEYKEGREQPLRNKLLPIKDQYDYIIIDCPPSLGLLNTNALTASDSVIIPVQCHYYSLEGLTQLLSTIRLVQKLFNRHLYIEGVLLTMLDSRTNLSIEVQRDVSKHFKEKVYKTYIPHNVRLAEAPSYGKSIFEYDIKCAGAQAYASLAKEVIARNEKEDSVNG